jgi:uncharacterized protein (DUF983 family)
VGCGRNRASLIGAEHSGVLKSALLGRYPRCGGGHVFAGVLDIRPACTACGLDFSTHHAGAGPAMAGIFMMHAIGAVLALSLLVRRFAKAMLLGLQWRHRRTS